VKATAIAHPNIALVKYWGKRDVALNLPATPSLSLTLGRFQTQTAVDWGVERDRFIVDDIEQTGARADRIARFLDVVVVDRPPVAVVSASNFPVAAGLASSSSAFAALALAATRAAGIELGAAALSALARRGSGSASRSLFGGFALWHRGEAADGADSHAVPLAPADHWDLRIIAAVVDSGPKSIGSTQGMIRSQQTSPHYADFVESAPALVDRARRAVLDRDLATLIEVMERSTTKMHQVFASTHPPLAYVRPLSRLVIERVERIRSDGVLCGWTMDAGPNVKVLCATDDAEQVAAALRALVSRVEILQPGGPARLVSEPR
jgi:diphosphomevalonate decarboxylase